MLDYNEAVKYEYRKLVQELYKHGYSVDIYSNNSVEYAREIVCIKMSYKKSYSYMVVNLEDLNTIYGILLLLLAKLNHEVEKGVQKETNGDDVRR